MAVAAPAAETVYRPRLPVDVARTLAPLRRGTGDPTHRVDADGTVWRTTRMLSGPASYRLTQRGAREVSCQAWGPGAAEVVEGLPGLLGAADDASTFEPRHPLVVQAHRRYPGLRVPSTGRVLESLVPAVLEQKVTGKEAWLSFRTLLQRHGEPAPGPAPMGMRVPPDADLWRRLPSWEWHRAGVDPARARTIYRAAQVASRLEECVQLTPSAAAARLQAVPGIGIWTAAEVSQRALGDADALSVGDYHLSAYVGWSLVGRPLDDAAMVELLEPWRPHRYRVIRLLELAAPPKPRFGPRATVNNHRWH
ncbi:MAG TPA: DNA-3-methyladenine glycosylase 2 family protein [Mycobacteriales bacterium]|nr:DNA-3-methyladenine glycosylase 2 family protein [Mycobacteriales bacterium]